MTLIDQAVRAQLLVPQQVELFDYWASKSSETAFPRRADIHPAELRALLPCLSLMDVTEYAPLQLRVRLAGTRLRDYLGVEITGRTLDELDLRDQRDYWETAYREVVEYRRPAQGVVPLMPWQRAGVFQFWLRLPLVNEDGRIVMVLGHDAFMQSTKASALAARAGQRIASA